MMDAFHGRIAADPLATDAIDAAASITGELHGWPPAASESRTIGAEVLQSWRRDRHRLTDRLNGVHALALHTSDEHLLYRDPSGLQNLFWCRTGNGDIAYASDLSMLRAMYGVPRRIARESLHEYLRFLDIAAPRTFIEGVHALPAGHWLSVPRDGSQPVEQAAPRPPAAAVAGFDDAVNQLDRLLHEAIALRLDRCAHPALLLSGGVDSALIATLAASVRPDIVAVTVGFDAAGLDEAPIAAAIASRLRLRHVVLRFGREALLSAFGRAAAGMEQPTADPSLPATILALDHCRAHHDAVLDGTGADEAVGALPPRHLQLLVSLSDRIRAPLRLRIARMLRATPRLAAQASLFDFEHPAEPFIRWGGFSRAEIERLCGQPVSLAETQFFRTFERFARHAHFDRYSALIDAMPCERVNQAMRIAGMRLRFPFADRRVDAFLRQLPAEYRDAPGQPKRILRALLARYLPREMWDGPKHGFNFPLHEFLLDDRASLVREQLDAPRWRRMGLLDADEVARHARDFVAGDRKKVFRVWALAVLGAWLDMHDELH